MKRLVIILCLLAVVIGFAGLEIWYSNSFYTKNIKNLTVLQKSIEENKPHISNPETLRLAHKANNAWEKEKKTVMKIANHSVVRTIDEKFVTLLTAIQLENDDALIATATLISFFKDIRQEAYPLLRNII